jgi:hypothetical protein
MQNKWFALAYYCLILPFMRELTRFIATKCAWYLTSDAEINGAEREDTLHREVAWVFVAWLQIFWAVYYRLAVANMQSFGASLFVVSWQAFLEIVLRLTMVQRDKAIGRIKTRALRLERRHTKVIDWSARGTLNSIVSLPKETGSRADVKNA